jgi:hypothetical protein
VTHVLFVLLLNNKTPIQLKTQEFLSEIQCLQAIHKVLELESTHSKIKAICIKK